MGLSFLAPLFFAGAALLAAPYIIHQIRRPEREPMRFSSVLFIPDIPKEVIERRRIQHWLLMLMRMGVLALLALAFARPYWRAMAAAPEGDAPVRHMILVDTSYSMSAGNAFDQAKRAARGLINDVKSAEPVGVILFAQHPRVVAPLASPGNGDAGSKGAARTAVDLAALTNEATDYLSALEKAQQLLLADAGDGDSRARRNIVHLVTDVQRTGLPEHHTGWKLSPSIELDVVPVGEAPPPNFAVTDAHVRLAQSGGGLRVLGKIRNWTRKDTKALPVTLVVDGEKIATKTLDVKARSATQISFTLPEPDEPIAAGYLQVGRGGVPADDRRYFAWSPPRQTRVAVVARAEVDERWPARWFFERALPPDPRLPWRTFVAEPDELADLLADPAGRPQVVILADLADLDAENAQLLRGYMEQGGQVLAALSANLKPEAINGLLLEPLGLRADEPYFTAPKPNRFQMMSWIDLEHPIFVPFQGTRFNDFSALRFFNYIPVDVQDPAHALARFENGAPAIVEAPVGDGRLMVWPFAVQLEWTNFPKTKRFVPLLYESLAYLTDLREERRTWIVGETLRAADLVFDAEGRGDVVLPGEATPVTVDAEAESMPLDEPGVLRLRPRGAPHWVAVQPVNVDPQEGDLTRFTPEAFQLKVSSAPVAPTNTDEAGIVGTEVDRAGYVIDREYGRWALLAVLVLIAAETWYMSRLGSKVTKRPSGGS